MIEDCVDYCEFDRISLYFDQIYKRFQISVSLACSIWSPSVDDTNQFSLQAFDKTSNPEFYWQVQSPVVSFIGRFGWTYIYFFVSSPYEKSFK